MPVSQFPSFLVVDVHDARRSDAQWKALLEKQVHTIEAFFRLAVRYDKKTIDQKKSQRLGYVATITRSACISVCNEDLCGVYFDEREFMCYTSGEHDSKYWLLQLSSRQDECVIADRRASTWFQKNVYTFALISKAWQINIRNIIDNEHRDLQSSEHTEKQPRTHHHQQLCETPANEDEEWPDRKLVQDAYAGLLLAINVTKQEHDHVARVPARTNHPQETAHTQPCVCGTILHWCDMCANWRTGHSSFQIGQSEC